MAETVQGNFPTAVLGGPGGRGEGMGEAASLPSSRASTRQRPTMLCESWEFMIPVDKTRQLTLRPLEGNSEIVLIR